MYGLKVVHAICGHTGKSVFGSRSSSPHPSSLRAPSPMDQPPSASAPPAAPHVDLPPAHLCDLAVQLLCEVSPSTNPITPLKVWSRPNRTRHPSPCNPADCCLVRVTPRAAHHTPAAMPFYFGKDAAGYTVVTPRCKEVAEVWPHAKGRPVPVRVCRWMLQASKSEGVVRHDCDDTRCIAVAHLRAGTQRDNLLDSVLRKRRQRSPVAPPRGSSSSEVGAAAASPSRALVWRRKVAHSRSTFCSPSKLARKAMRAAHRAASECAAP